MAKKVKAKVLVLKGLRFAVTAEADLPNMDYRSQRYKLAGNGTLNARHTGLVKLIKLSADFDAGGRLGVVDAFIINGGKRKAFSEAVRTDWAKSFVEFSKSPAGKAIIAAARRDAVRRELGRQQADLREDQARCRKITRRITQLEAMVRRMLRQKP